MNLELDNPEAIKMTETDGNINFTMITAADPFEIQTTKINAYRKDAQRILDHESLTLNKVGIEALLAALIIEVRGFENYGIDNPKP